MSRGQQSLLQYLQGKDYPSILDPSQLQSLQEKKTFLKEVLKYIQSAVNTSRNDILCCCDPILIRLIFKVVHACHNLLGSLLFKYSFITHFCCADACEVTHESRRSVDMYRDIVQGYVPCFKYYLFELNSAIDHIDNISSLDLIGKILLRVYRILVKVNLNTEFCARGVTGEYPFHE